MKLSDAKLAKMHQLVDLIREGKIPRGTMAWRYEQERMYGSAGKTSQEGEGVPANARAKGTDKSVALRRGRPRTEEFAV